MLINKKTFYHYYETLDALLAEMQVELSSEYIERIKDYELPGELDKVKPYVWYSIGESNTEEPGRKPLQEGGFSHAAHECNIKCNNELRAKRFLMGVGK